MNDSLNPIQVTKLEPNINNKRVKKKTTETVQFEDVEQSHDAIIQVTKLREMVEDKESQVARLREALARETEIDVPKAMQQLKAVQAAFDLVQQQAKSRLLPVEDDRNDAIADYKAKKRYMHQFSIESQERNDAFERLSDKITEEIAELHSPEIQPIDESCLYPIAQDIIMITNTIDAKKRMCSLESVNEKALDRLNKILARELDEAGERESRAERKAKTVKKDLDVRFKMQKQPVLDQTWYQEDSHMERNQLKLEQLKKMIKIMTEDAQNISTNNRNLVEKISILNEELHDLDKYIPTENADHIEGTIRADLTEAEIKRDYGQVQILVLKNKLKKYQQILNAVQSNQAEFAKMLDSYKEKLEFAKNDRKQADVELNEVNDERSMLLSKKEFLVAQKELLVERIKEHNGLLSKSESLTHKYEEILQKQRTIKDLNDRKEKLKAMNLERVANTVNDMIHLNGEIDPEVNISEPVSSSSVRSQESNSLSS